MWIVELLNTTLLNMDLVTSMLLLVQLVLEMLIWELGGVVSSSGTLAGMTSLFPEVAAASTWDISFRTAMHGPREYRSMLSTF